MTQTNNPITTNTSPDIPVLEFDQYTAPEEDLHQYLDLRQLLAEEVDPDHIPAPREQQITSLRDKDEKMSFYRWIIRKDDTIIGTAALVYMNEKHPGYEQNKDSLFSELRIHPKYRRQGLGKALLSAMITKSKEFDRTQLYTSTDNPTGQEFAEHLGGKVALKSAENRLYLKEVDWDMVKQWVDAGPQRAPGVTLQEFTTLPEDIASKYMDIYNETFNQQPLGEVEVEFREDLDSRRQMEERFAKIGVLWYTLISKEEDGSISGLTEIFYNPQTPHKAQQNLTGVKHEYRGRGLGKWLKAEMLLRLNDRHPGIDYITTGNADVNAPMLSINERLGFKRFKSSVSYRFQLEDLQAKFG